jgi:hypothetical protein
LIWSISDINAITYEMSDREFGIGRRTSGHFWTAENWQVVEKCRGVDRWLD